MLDLCLMGLECVFLCYNLRSSVNSSKILIILYKKIKI